MEHDASFRRWGRWLCRESSNSTVEGGESITMADDTAVDLTTFPGGVDLPSELTADQSGDGSLDTGATMLPFQFCILFAGRPWGTLPVNAPSPELAATTVDQFVRQVLNPGLVRAGYPPNICSWSAGACA
jgi:hypothetical protein